MTSPDNKTKAVYRGRETECVVASLLPGRPYLFQVRAFNRVGPGPWSDSLEVVSGAGSPDGPMAPHVQCRYIFLFTIVFFGKRKNSTHKTFHILKMKAHFEKEPHFKNKSSFQNPF